MGIFDKIQEAAETVAKRGERPQFMGAGKYVLQLVKAEQRVNQKKLEMEGIEIPYLQTTWIVKDVVEGSAHAIGDKVQWQAHTKMQENAAKLIMGALGITKDQCTPDLATAFFENKFEGIPVHFHNFQDGYEHKTKKDENGDPLKITYVSVNAKAPLTKAEVKKLKLDVPKDVLDDLK